MMNYKLEVLISLHLCAYSQHESRGSLLRRRGSLLRHRGSLLRRVLDERVTTTGHKYGYNQVMRTIYVHWQRLL